MFKALFSRLFSDEFGTGISLVVVDYSGCLYFDQADQSGLLAVIF